MESPQTTQPRIEELGQSLGRSLQQHFAHSDAIRSAFANLEFELDLLRQPAPAAALVELP